MKKSGTNNLNGIQIVELPEEYNSSIDLDKEFMVPSSDSKGHSLKIQARVMPAVHNEIEIRSKSGSYPYRNTSDFVRHAVMRHLKWLDGLDGEVTTVMGQIQVVMDIARYTEARAELARMMDTLDKEVQEIKALGDQDMLHEMLDSVLESIDAMPEGKWRDKALEDYNRRYGDIV